MTLITTGEILGPPNQDGGFAVGAFNVHNMEYTQAVIQAAELEDSPVILMIGEAMIPFAGLDMLSTICLHAARRARVPVAVALDHGKQSRNIDRCLELGICVMVDGSHLPFGENVRLTRAVCQQAHQLGLTVEGELGSIGGSEDGEAERLARMTDPEAAEEFVRQTEVDILAVSVGNYHGLYTAPPRIDLARIKAIREQVSIPIVMHGGSDMAEELTRAVIQAGMSKFNIGTDLKYAFSKQLKAVLAKDPLPFQPPEVLGSAREAVCEVTRLKIRSFGSNGKAGLYEG